MESRSLTIEQLASAKFRLARSLDTKIVEHRRRLRGESFQQVLFDGSGTIEVSPDVVHVLDHERYAPNWPYEGGYSFLKKAFPVIGELKSEGEEFECAIRFDALPEVNCWVRNLERRPTTSFWLQTSTDRFYPDFVARLRDGRFLVVGYKSERDWTNDDSREKRRIGELWEARSNGRCLFVMPQGPDWAALEATVRS